MKISKKQIKDKLIEIYAKYQKRYKENPNSKQMCCMWSTDDPPDFLEDTPPIRDIEKAFGLSLEEYDCMELYDLEIKEAAAKIAEFIKRRHS